ELGLEAFQQRKSIGGGAGEATDDLAVVQPADLVGVALHDDVAERDLAVAADGNAAVVSHGQDRRGTDGGHNCAPGEANYTMGSATADWTATAPFPASARGRIMKGRRRPARLGGPSLHILGDSSHVGCRTLDRGLCPSGRLAA